MGSSGSSEYCSSSVPSESNSEDWFTQTFFSYLSEEAGVNQSEDSQTLSRSSRNTQSTSTDSRFNSSHTGSIRDLRHNKNIYEYSPTLSHPEDSQNISCFSRSPRLISTDPKFIPSSTQHNIIFPQYNSVLSQCTNSSGVSIQENILSSQLHLAWEKQNKEIILSFCNAVVAALKSSSKLFQELFIRTYAENTLEELSISGSNEFRIDIILDLPFNSDARKIYPIRENSGYACYKLHDGWDTVSHGNNRALDGMILEMKEFLLKDGYLMPSKVRSWMKSLTNKLPAWTCLWQLKHVCGITVCDDPQGNVYKLHSVFQGIPYQISVKLNPVLRLSLSEIPNSFETSLREYGVPDYVQFFHMVPDEYNGIYCNKRSEHAKRFWKLNVPGVTNFIIHNAGCAKTIIDLLQVLWEKQKWHILPSYIFKTAVLALIIENPDIRYWEEANMLLRLTEALEFLSDCLSEFHLQDVYFRDNLLHNIDAACISNINAKLQNIINDLEDNFVENVNKYF